MKTTILTAALMILMTVANAKSIDDTNFISGAPEKTFQASVCKTSPEMIRFSVQNPGQEKIILKVYNDDNIKVYQKTVRKEKGINLGCDMSQAEKGNYTFIIERNGKAEVKKTIALF